MNFRSMLVLFVCWSTLATGSWAQDAAKTADPVTTSWSRDSGLDAMVASLRGKPIRVAALRYAGDQWPDEAYERVEKAMAEVLRTRGLAVAAGASQGVVTLEIDPAFYVFTSKFNARRVRLVEYVNAQLQDAAAQPAVVAPPKPVDALRVVAGALGIVRGWISPSFGGYMIASGSTASNELNRATAAIFGGGKAPVRILLPDRERYERGEQQLSTKLTLSIDGRRESAAVESLVGGDTAPFRVDELVLANWLAVADRLGRAAVEVGRQDLSGR